MKKKHKIILILTVCIAAVAGIALATYWLWPYYQLHIIYNDVARLEKDAPVKCKGLTIGRVGKVSLDDGRAVVTVNIRKDIKIRAGSAFKQEIAGITGSRRINVVLSDQSAFLEPGTEVKGVEYYNTPESEEMQKIGNQVLNMIQNIAKGKPPPSLTIPKEATGVKYVDNNPPGVGFEEYLKFRVPPEGCVSAAKVLLKQHYRKPVDIVETDIQDFGLSQLRGPDWFRKNKIQMGKMLHRKKPSNSGAPVVYVDTETGWVYYLLTD